MYNTDKSWGMIGLNKVHDGGVEGRRLFGSDVPIRDFMEIVISQCEVERKLNQDWRTGSKTITSIYLTPSQFADMLTTMNCGNGVPCTINYTEKDGHIKFKSEDNKLDLIFEEREKEIDEGIEDLQLTINKLKEMVDCKKIGKTIGEELINNLSRTSSVLTGKGREFANEQAKREIIAMTTEAKRNIQSYVDYKIYQTGLNSIKTDIAELNFGEKDKYINNTIEEK